MHHQILRGYKGNSLIIDDSSNRYRKKNLARNQNFGISKNPSVQILDYYTKSLFLIGESARHPGTCFTLPLAIAKFWNFRSKSIGSTTHIPDRSIHLSANHHKWWANQKSHDLGHRRWKGKACSWVPNPSAH